MVSKAEWQRQNKDKVAIHTKKYYEANKERCIECIISWQKQNKDKVAGYSKAYYESHKEEIKAKRRARYAKQREASNHAEPT